MRQSYNPQNGETHFSEWSPSGFCVFPKLSRLWDTLGHTMVRQASIDRGLRNSQSPRNHPQARPLVPQFDRAGMVYNLKRMLRVLGGTRLRVALVS